MIMHQAVESMFGLTEREITRKTARYLPKVLEKCLNVIIREALRE